MMGSIVMMSAGFALYSRRTDALLRQMTSASHRMSQVHNTHMMTASVKTTSSSSSSTTEKAASAMMNANSVKLSSVAEKAGKLRRALAATKS